MAVAFDAQNSVSGLTVTTLTTSSWTIAGSNRALVAGMGWAAGVPPTYSEMRWQGSTGTLLTQVGTTLSFSIGRAALARLIAPAAAAGTLYGALSGSTDGMIIGGCSFTGVDQTTPLGTAITATATNQVSPATASAASVVSATNDMVVDFCFGNTAPGGSTLFTIAVGTGQTLRWEMESVGGAFGATQSTEPGAASVTMTEVLTCDTNLDYGIFGVSVKQAAAGRIMGSLAGLGGLAGAGGLAGRGGGLAG